MSILVTGGAGYIGSITAAALLARGEDVIILDDLSRGNANAVPEGAHFYRGSIADTALLKRIFSRHSVEACLHFAALAYVGESMSDPAKYFDTNVAQTIVLMNALIAAGVRRVVFSSSCATYGSAQFLPLTEDHRQQPESPYGWSKLITERLLASYDAAYGMRFVALRYFNAAGATADRGEMHDPETHLIPNVLAAATSPSRTVSIFGGDFSTPDGSAVRDYVHVSDLASGHALALDYLRSGGKSDYFNLGSGSGYSVLDIVKAARTVTGIAIKARMEPARPGDPPCLAASADKAKSVLGWRPVASSRRNIIESAWRWHCTQMARSELSTELSSAL